MIIDVKKSVAAKNFKGSLNFSYVPPKDLLMVPLIEFKGDVNVKTTYEIFEDDSVCVNLEISYRLVGQCSYCLADAQKDVNFSEEVYFVPEQSDDDYEYDGVKINLQTAVNDAILFSQPNVVLCNNCLEGVDDQSK